MVRRQRIGSTNVTIRKGLVEAIEEELVKPGYLGYASNAEVMHDAGRLLLLLVALVKRERGESVHSVELARLLGGLRKTREGTP